MALPITQAVKDLFLNNTLQTISITATPLEGSAITITEADIVQGSFSIDRSSVASSDIEIGNASSAELMMTLNNVSDFVYEGATLLVSVAVDGNTVPMGVFVVDEVKRVKTTTNIIALDKMVAFDKDADKTAFADGLTPSQVLTVCCTQCGVTLGDVTDMVNPNITVNVSAIEDGFTYRDLIIWIGECTATNAFVNESGSLVMKWYNGNAVATLTEENRVASDLQNYPVEITGVKIIDGDTEYISGEEGYVIKIENNPLIVQNSIATRLSAIATRLVGFSYQPWSAETLPMPWVMPFDMIDFVKGETTHNTIVTNSQFWLNRNTQFAGKGESPMAKGYAQKALTKQQQNVVKGVERKSELGDQALQNQITEINNHFWFDSAGAHVSTIAGDASHGNNVLLDSDSLDIRVGETIRASFGENTRIGGINNTHIEMTFNQLCLKDKEGSEYFLVKDMRNEQGVATVTDSYTTNGQTTSYSLNLADAVDANYSVSLDGVEVTSGITKTKSGFTFATAPAGGQILRATYETLSPMAKYLTFGYRFDDVYGSHPAPLSSVLGVGIASDLGAFAEGFFTQATAHTAHAEGSHTVSRGMGAHAEGIQTDASGGASHAEGQLTTASGNSAHAEGVRSVASGNYSHSEGFYSVASGYASHAQNSYTKAEGSNQTALGKYNISDTTSAVIVGNGGSETNRSNTFTLDWDGHAKLIGQNPEVRLTNVTTASSYIRAEPADKNGNNLLIHAGGNLIVGSGEYANNRYNAGLVLDTGENAYIGADNNLYIESNAQTITNRKTFTFATNGNFTSAGDVLTSGGNSLNNAFVYHGKVAVNTNLNTVMNAGRYHFSSSDNVTNAPSGVTWGLLEVLRNGNAGGIVMQRITRNNRVFTRQTTDTGSTWSSWVTQAVSSIINNGANWGGTNSQSIPTGNTWTSVGSVTLSAGTYIVIATASWDSNSNGIRKISVNTSADVAPSMGHGWLDYRPAVNGDTTSCKVMGILAPTTDTTYYMNVSQNSGSAVTVRPRATIVRIA